MRTIKFVLPISVIASSRDTRSGQLNVHVPQSKFQTNIYFELPAIKDTDNIEQPCWSAILQIPIRFKPLVMHISCQLDDALSRCVIYKMRAFKYPENEFDQFREDPVRTLSQRLNDKEISLAISNLDPAFNFRSWSNAWLDNDSKLLHRFFCDSRAHKGPRRAAFLSARLSNT